MMESKQTSTQTNSGRAYVLVVDSDGETDILQLSYDIKWEDVAVMLQIKFDYEDVPVYTYTDDEEDYIALDSQEAFDKALKIGKRNSDVIHIQMRKGGQRMLKPRQATPDNNTPVLNTDHSEAKRTTERINNTLGWATNAVKSVFSEIGRGIRSSPPNGEDVSMQECPSLSSQHVPASSEATVQDEEITSSSMDLHPTQYEEGGETEIKEPVDSETSEISVPTSLITDADEMEVVVKMPIATCSYANRDMFDETKHDSSGNTEMIRSIKEEVRMAISQELSVFRDEINTSIIQNLGSKTKPATSQNLTSETAASPDGHRTAKMIKEEIKQLKREMKTAKLQKKQNKQNKTIRASDAGDETKKQTRKYAASFICENLLDGSCVEIGQKFVKYWVLKNEGTLAWDNMIQLELLQESPSCEGSSVDPSSTVDEQTEESAEVRAKIWGPEHHSIEMPIVNSNGTAVIAVSHVAPAYPCTYTSSWRLTHEGRAFGPRIWCSVNVMTKDQLPSSYEPQSYDASLLESDQGQSSYMSKIWVPSHNDGVEVLGDDLSNMLSFEMTAVGDYSKPVTQSNIIETDHTYVFSGTNTAPQDVIQTENSEVAEEQEQPLMEEQESPTAEDQVSDFESVSDVDEETHIKETAFENVKNDVEENVESETNEEVDEDECSTEVEDASSDITSDFEVIPLPECFDTSRPLPGSEPSDNEEEDLPSIVSNTTTVQSAEYVLEEAEQVAEVESAAEEVEVPEVLECIEFDETDAIPFIHATAPDKDATPVASLTITDGPAALHASSIPSEMHGTRPVAPAPSPVPQSVLDMDKPFGVGQSSPASQCKPIPIPQSVLDMEKPRPVADYSQGYETPSQKTAPTDQKCANQPIPLPRGVLDADKPWAKVEPSSGPSPHPRTPSTAPRSSSELQLEEPWDARQSLEVQIIDVTPPTNTPPHDEDDDSPQIFYPPQAEPEEADEFTLASENGHYPTLPTQILVPPGYPAAPIATPTAHLHETPQAPAPPAHRNPPNPEPYDPSPMEQLIDMGFMDIDLNYDLLREFQGDVNRVVQALVYRGTSTGNQHRANHGTSDGSFIA